MAGYGGNLAYLLIPNQNGGPPLIIPVVFYQITYSNCLLTPKTIQTIKI